MRKFGSCVFVADDAHIDVNLPKAFAQVAFMLLNQANQPGEHADYPSINISVKQDITQPFLYTVIGEIQSKQVGYSYAEVFKMFADEMYKMRKEGEQE